MTGLTGNREFCFPKFLNVPLGDRLQVQVGAKVTGHPKTQTVQTEYFFFLILVFAYTFDLHFFGSHHKIEFNYMSECFLFVTTYRRATQARYVTVDSILTSTLYCLIDIGRKTLFSSKNA